ncbi:MAG TPA: hypothetical protein VKV95_18830 [Terriglobia bacterium]|nr:hypothetical protein [Terriglobia bacterium]
MQTTGKFDRNTDVLRRLKRLIESEKDANEKLIYQSWLILHSAKEVGANIERLVEHTGCPRELVEAISRRMRDADLWIGERVDGLGYWEDDGNISFEFFNHALVARGELVRGWPRKGRYRYVDLETGEVWDAIGSPSSHEQPA